MICLDLLQLGRDVAALEGAGIDALHLDLVDGTYAPTLGLPADLIARLRQVTELPLHVHLMSAAPLRYTDILCAARPASVSVPLVSPNEWSALRARLGPDIELGLTLTAQDAVTPRELREYAADLVTVICVRPGFHGQPFIEGSLDAIARLIDHVPLVEADGAVGAQTLAALANAGCRAFVLGSRALPAGWSPSTIAQLRALAAANATAPAVSA